MQVTGLKSSLCCVFGCRSGRSIFFFDLRMVLVQKQKLAIIIFMLQQFEMFECNISWQGRQHKGNLPPFLGSAVVPPEGATTSSAKDALSILESHQALLLEAVSEFSELQDNDQEKQQTAEAISVKYARMREFAKRVGDAEQVLDSIIEEFEEYRKPKRAKEGCQDLSKKGEDIHIEPGMVNVQELVAYAHRISYTTFAPPEFASGQAPLRGAFPPAPQEEQMRASQLYFFSDMDVGLPKPEAPVPPILPSVDASVDAGKIKLEGTGTPQATRAPIGVPLPPSVPAGWKPGMPIELPAELPPMPPGWKPGDPIPFPPGMELPAVMPPGWKPGDAVVLPPAPSRPSEAGATTSSAPVASVQPAANQGVIHVPFVQLDLNPELEDDYGSDYTDDDDSSEEDED
ncbi:hypothetical protein O6H91_21G004300 [Diphasiastrum complanatum]|uniref:Uncharacterized protein n=1 Tax=Diphasiastrum complanatum TaxID=34168 RepID=A0ACC2AH85_DIPCM|nr:hypothetical protein O6H91_21G004300 [Diphasiastrum complanatum]